MSSVYCGHRTDKQADSWQCVFGLAQTFESYPGQLTKMCILYLVEQAQFTFVESLAVLSPCCRRQHAGSGSWRPSHGIQGTQGAAKSHSPSLSRDLINCLLHLARLRKIEEAEKLRDGKSDRRFCNPRNLIKTVQNEKLEQNTKNIKSFL